MRSADVKKIAVYYSKPGENDNFTFWGHEYAEILTSEIAKLLGAEIIYKTPVERIRMKKSYGDQLWPLYGKNVDADISFIQPYSHFKKRLSGKIIVAIGDYRFYKAKVHGWLQEIKPDLVLCTDEMPESLRNLCSELAIRYEWMPYFVADMPKYNSNRYIQAFISGCINTVIYPFRYEAYKVLKDMAAFNDDISVSCNRRFGEYSLSKKDYLRTLQITRYYFTGGICDEIVPPKMFEAAAAGCCVVCNSMPMLEKWGFVDGKTCIVIKHVRQIGEVVNGDDWRRIGLDAQALIRARHTVERRAEDIVKMISEMIF